MAPKALADASTQRPATMLRLSPTRCTASPVTRPSVMPASCTRDSRKPACSSETPSTWPSTGKAGGSLPTCRAATTPAAITHQAACALAVVSGLDSVTRCKAGGGSSREGGSPFEALMLFGGKAVRHAGDVIGHHALGLRARGMRRVDANEAAAV